MVSQNEEFLQQLSNVRIEELSGGRYWPF